MAKVDVHACPKEESVEAAIRRAAGLLTKAGIEGAARDARLLVSAATGLSAADLILRPGAAISDQAGALLDAMLARRLAREPVSRILGVREFYGREFMLSPATLDPRPDSETLIEAVLQIVDQEGGRHRPLRLIDVGTGTGCLLLTLLAELPTAAGVGTDISSEALIIAQRNADQLGLSGRARFELRSSLDGTCDTFDILVSNPPYIPTLEVDDLDAEVRTFDPRGALDGGPDGLDVFRSMARRLDLVVPAGWAFFEVGAGQASDVAGLLALGRRSLHRRIKTWRDLGGHQRCVAVEIHR